MNYFREVILGEGKKYVVVEWYRNLDIEFFSGKEVGRFLFFSLGD